MSILIIDIETTGIDPEESRIVEIGCVELDDDMERPRIGECLVNPGIPIPPEASAVHHLTDRHVSDAIQLEEALDWLPVASIYVAHNARYEAAFLPKLGAWLCTYKAAVRVWPEAPSHSLQALRYWRGLHDIEGLAPDAPMHRALPDALVTVALLRELAKVASIEDMVEWTKQPVMLPKFTFGKHAGVPVKDIPPDYLEWILGKDFDEDVMHTARTELERRRAA